MQQEYLLYFSKLHAASSIYVNVEGDGRTIDPYCVSFGFLVVSLVLAIVLVCCQVWCRHFISKEVYSSLVEKPLILDCQSLLASCIIFLVQ